MRGLSAYSSRLLAVAAACCACLTAVSAPAPSSTLTVAQTPTPSPEPDRLTLHTDRVVVFKDGYGLFVKSAKAVADAQGRVFTEEVPDRAILGCFWAFRPDGRVRSITAEVIERKETRGAPRPCISVLDLLRANVGHSLVLELNGDAPFDREEVPCRILAVLDMWEDPDASPAPVAGPPGPGELRIPPSRYVSHVSARPDESAPAVFGTTTRELAPKGGELVLIETAERQQRVLPISKIAMLRTADELTTLTSRREEVVTRTKRLTFDLGAEAANQPVALQILYFAEGIRWIPTYRLTGALETDGELALQGEILNEAEDFDHASLELVGGVPNFRFKSSPSPLTFERQLRLALPQAAPGLVGVQMMNNAMMQQAEGSFQSRTETPSPTDEALALAPELGTEPGQDLFAYSLGEYSLKKGARTAVSLWTSSVAIHHLYTASLRVVRTREGGKSVQSAQQPSWAPSALAIDSPLSLNPNRVWHQLEIANATKVPWTTGAIFLMRNQLPLGQDLLTYTPVRGKSLVPVTVAVDVRAKFEEEEISRQDNALRWDNRDYTLVRQRGTVTVTNSKDQPIRVRPKVAVGGRAEKVSEGGTIRVGEFHSEDWTDPWPARYNNHSEVEWNLTLNPGETKTVTFEYGYYL